LFEVNKNKHFKKLVVEENRMPTIISVIIPVYNVEKFLRKCLDSVLTQSMEEFEVLLINDGSTDESSKICEQYAEQDQRFKVFHTKNSGPSKARNFGIQKAVGEYIMFIDADDYLDQDTFNTVWNTIEKASTDLVVYPFYEKKEDLVEKREVNECYFDNRVDKANFLKKVWITDEMLSSTWNKLYKAEIIKQNNIVFNEDFLIAEDYLFNLNYIDVVDNGVSINTPLYYYIRHDNSISSRVIYNKYEIALTVYKESLKLLEKYNIKESNCINKIQREFATAVVRAMFETTKPGYNRNLFEKLREINRYMSDIEIRALFSSYFDFSMFNNLVIFCMKYKQGILFYLIFRIRNAAKSLLK
jgi:glycosyltransferase involved in cell wall biosynthesis